MEFEIVCYGESGMVAFEGVGFVTDGSWELVKMEKGELENFRG